MLIIRPKTILFTLIFILSVIGIFVINKSKNNSSNVQSTYVIHPLINYLICLENVNIEREFIINNCNANDVPFPKVEIPPFSNFYIFTQIEESLNKPESLQLSSKRIGEIARWGDALRIQGSFSTIDSILAWWNNPDSDKNTDSWESEFARYYNAINDSSQIAGKDYAKQNVHLVQIHRHLNYHENLINSVILSLQKSSQEKVYLLSLSEKLFALLKKKLNAQLPIEGSILGNRYSLNSINFGRYTLIPDIEEKEIWELFINGRLKHSEFSPVYNQQLVKNVKLENNTIVELSPKQSINLLKEQQWNFKEKTDNNIYEYLLSISKIQINKKYLISVTYLVKEIKLLKLEQVSLKNPKETITMWQKNTFPTNNRKSVHTAVRFYLDSGSATTQFVLQSLTPMSSEMLKDLEIQIIPVFNPDLTLIAEKNTNNILNQNVQNPFLKLLFGLIASFAFFQLIREITIPQKIKNYIKEFARQTRYLNISSLVIVSIIATIFFQLPPAIILVVVTYTLIMTVIGFQISLKNYTKLLLLLVFADSIFFGFGFKGIAERIAIWVYLTLCIMMLYPIHNKSLKS